MDAYSGDPETHRATLLLGSSFSESELRASYKKLIRQWHPDRYPSGSQQQAEATEKAKDINVAYECLSDYLEACGGIYRPVHPSAGWAGAAPKRTYEGQPYTIGFPDPSVTEIFLRSSHIVSTGYNRVTSTLYIKFSGMAVYRYFAVSEQVFEAFLGASSHGTFAHRNIYRRHRQERC